MKNKLLTRMILFGFLTWLLPFAISFLFFKPGAGLVIPHELFKSLMVVIGSITGCYFLFRYFSFVERNYIKNGLLVGFSWLAISLLLDFLFLLPISKQTVAAYLMSIGLRYAIIPVLSISMGYLIASKNKKQRQHSFQAGAD